MTREHLGLLLATDLPTIVAITKSDLVDADRLERVDPAVILTLGNAATRAALDTDEGITDSWLWSISTGLVVPVIRDAGQKNLVGLARTAAELAERARDKQLQPDDLQGGTFTVTNIGSLGSIMGTPIISQPQVGILATGAIKKRPVVIEHPELGDTIAIRHMMYVSLSYDHRIIDGSMGASYLQAYKEALENIDPNEAI